MAQWVRVSTGKSGADVWRGPRVHRKQGDPTEIAVEAERLVWLAQQGIPCPEVVAHEPGVLVTTTLAGRSGAEPWTDELRPRVVDAIVDVLRSLHGLGVAGCPFDRTLRVSVPAAEDAAASGGVDLRDLDPQRTGWSTAWLLEELHRARPASEDPVVCHGDPTLANAVFTEDGRLSGVLDVGRLGVADRYSDLAIATRSIAGRWHPRYGERLLRRYGIGAADVAKIRFYRLLDEFF